MDDEVKETREGAHVKRGRPHEITHTNTCTRSLVSIVSISKKMMASNFAVGCAVCLGVAQARAAFIYIRDGQLVNGLVAQ